MNSWVSKLESDLFDKENVSQNPRTTSTAKIHYRKLRKQVTHFIKKNIDDPSIHSCAPCGVQLCWYLYVVR